MPNKKFMLPSMPLTVIALKPGALAEFLSFLLRVLVSPLGCYLSVRAGVFDNLTLPCQSCPGAFPEPHSKNTPSQEEHVPWGLHFFCLKTGDTGLAPNSSVCTK